MSWTVLNRVITAQNEPAADGGDGLVCRSQLKLAAPIARSVVVVVVRTAAVRGAWGQ